jgi:beta-lactamase class A
MRRLAAALVLAALLGTAGPASAQDRWRPDVRAAATYANGRAGTVAFAVRTGKRLVGRGLDRQFRSASVIKAMLMVTYLRQRSVRSRALTAGERGLLEPMIRWSDNDAATHVRNVVGNPAVSRLARAAGMTRFVMDIVWGHSLITPRDQTRLFLRIDRLIPRRHRAYAMRLLRTIIPGQRWGMARVIPRGWRLYFKGGWGDGTGAVDHQVSQLRCGPRRVAVAVLTVGNPTHRYGNATLEGVSRRLVRGLEPQLQGAVVRQRGYLGIQPR